LSRLGSSKKDVTQVKQQGPQPNYIESSSYDMPKTKEKEPEISSAASSNRDSAQSEKASVGK